MLINSQFDLCCFNEIKKDFMLGTSLASQWLGLCASTAGVTGLIPGQGYKINDAQPKKKEKKKLFCLLVY